jgi:hypothetical protein
MTDPQQRPDDVTRTAAQLFQFAIDRGDMNIILDVLPWDAPGRRATLEYEIQILRIVSVGWAITYFLADNPLKTPLGHHFWQQVRAFSETLSASATLTAGSDIDYFNILKTRLEHYVDALEAAGKILQPAMAIGPAFAEICGNRDDACAVLAGSKMFVHAIHAVREHLDAVVGERG